MDWVQSEILHLWIIYQKLPLLTQWAVTLLIVAGFIVHFFAYNERTVHDGPSIFTTSGIFFTFVGIAEGLYDFDAQKIEASIPTLLEGLKTAFVASVFGVGIALTLKLRFAIFGVRRTADSTAGEDATVGDLVHQVSRVEKAIVGDDESTLLSQLKLSRQDANDKLNQLNDSLRDFLTRAVENNSRALIEALEAVIRDFNAKISEQFGENFKQLNAAVGQLLEWQHRYRAQMTEMIEQQTITAENMRSGSESMKEATEQYASLLGRAEQFTAVSEKLSTLLSGLELQRNQIEVSTRSLADLVSKAADGLPQVEAKIIQLTEQMTFGVRDHSEKISTSITQGSEALADTVENIKRLVLDSTQAANDAVNRHMNELAQKTNEQIVKIDTALETELQKSISSLARQLTALSGRFAEDYGPIADRLREVLRIAQAAR